MLPVSSNFVRFNVGWDFEVIAGTFTGCRLLRVELYNLCGLEIGLIK